MRKGHTAVAVLVTARVVVVDVDDAVVDDDEPGSSGSSPAVK